MVAVFQPVHTNGAREWIPGDLVLRAERVPRSLEDQGGRLDGPQMFDAGLSSFADRMEWVAQADETRHLRFVGNQAGNPPAQ